MAAVVPKPPSGARFLFPVTPAEAITIKAALLYYSTYDTSSPRLLTAERMRTLAERIERQRIQFETPRRVK